MKNKIEYIASKRGYIVSEEGILYNPKGCKIGFVNDQGYIQTRIRINKVGVKLKVHRLQAFQKYGVGLYKETVVARHFDGIKTNNSWENILIGTHSDNMMDIPEQIRIKKALYATSFVRKHDKKKIKKFHKTNKSYKKTMDKFNISSKGTLNYILNN